MRPKELQPLFRPWWPATLAFGGCIFFVLAGLAFVPLLGVEMDEALFGGVFYEPNAGVYSYRLGHWHLPLMVLPYLGTVKSWLYRPLFAGFGTGPAVLRVPALVGGAAGIWLLYLLLRRVSGERAALIGCGLLASDALYLLTSCFDWGPVVLQHLFLLGGMLLLVRFWQERRDWALAGGFFLLGLGMWDKALAVWTLGGLAVAALVTIPRQMFGILTVRRLAAAAGAFTAGILPLILYNIHTAGGTFRGTAVWDAGDIPGKTRILFETFRGSALIGWMTAYDTYFAQPHAPVGWWQQASAALAPLAGSPPHGLLPYAFGAALLLAPLARPAARRAILFALITMAVAWVQMLFTATAGGAVHHTILLWPLPQVIVGVSFAEVWGRLGRAGAPLAGAAVVLTIVSGLAVMNGYYALIVRNGGAISWSDAIFPLTDYLETHPAGYIFCLDWGYLDTLRLLSRNRLPVRVGSEQLAQPELSPADQAMLADIVSSRDSIFVAHTKKFEFYAGMNQRFVNFAQQLGYRPQLLAVISDSHARPTFEIYRLLPVAAR